MMVGVLWMFQFIAFALIALRLYARLLVVQTYGWDDHCFNASVVGLSLNTSLLFRSCKESRRKGLGMYIQCRRLKSKSQFLLLLYTVLVTVAATFGVGQVEDDLETESHALLLVNIAQIVVSLATVFVKLSITVFLYRLVSSNRRQKIAVVVPIVLLIIVSIVAMAVLWFTCTPISYGLDLTLVGGYCNGTLQFDLLLAGGLSILVVEIFYASFSWYLIRGLQMPKTEKIVIGACMSIGYL